MISLFRYKTIDRCLKVLIYIIVHRNIVSRGRNHQAVEYIRYELAAINSPISSNSLSTLT